VRFFGKQYLRPPNENDTARLLNIAEQREFPGMLGSIDVCIGSGKIIQQLYKACFVVT
jgi:hypothetical protein